MPHLRESWPTDTAASLFLPLGLANDLRARKQNDQRQPHPGQEAHGPSEFAIDAVISAEMSGIPAEKKCAQNPGSRGDGAPPAYPSPACMRPVGAELVNQGED